MGNTKTVRGLSVRQVGLLTRYARAASRAPKPRWTTRLVVTAFALLLMMGPLTVVGAGTVSAATTPATTGTIGTGSTVLIPGVALAFIGYYEWTGQWTPANAGSQIFAGGLAVELYGLTSKNITLTLGLSVQGRGFVSNTSVQVSLSLNPTIQLPFSPATSWTHVTLYIDHVAYWSAYFAVPLSLLPLSGYDVGGLDLLFLAGMSLVLFSFTGMTLIAKRLMKRVLTAPNFSLVVWGHVIIIAIAGAVLSNFQFVNSVLAGWSVLCYPIFLAPVWFFAMLSLFNKHKGTEILQLLSRSEGKVGFRRWLLRIGKTPDGKTVIMFPDWWDFWARVWGHFIVIDEGNPLKPSYFEADATRTFIHPAPEARRAPSEWPVVNPQVDDIERVMWSLSEVPIKTVRPKLTMHRQVTLPARLDKDGTTIIPSHDVRKLSLPHYLEGHAEWDLAPEMFAAALAVMARWASTRDLAIAYSQVKNELSLLKGYFSRRLEEEVASRLTAIEAALGDTERDITLDEAKALINEQRVAADHDRKKREMSL